MNTDHLIIGSPSTFISALEYDERALHLRTEDLNRLHEEIVLSPPSYDPDDLSSIEELPEDFPEDLKQPEFIEVRGRIGLRNTDIYYEPWGFLINDYPSEISVSETESYRNVSQCIFSVIFEELDELTSIQVRNLPFNVKQPLESMQYLRQYAQASWTKFYINKMMGYVEEALKNLLAQKSEPFYSVYMEATYDDSVIPIFVFRHSNIWGVSDESQIASRDFNLYGKILNRVIYERRRRAPSDTEICYIENGSPFDLFLGTNQEFTDSIGQGFSSIQHYIYFKFLQLFSRNTLESYAIVHANRNRPDDLEAILMIRIKSYFQQIIKRILPKILSIKFMNHKSLLIANMRVVRYFLDESVINPFFPIDSLLAIESNNLFSTMATAYELSLPVPRVSANLEKSEFEWIVFQRLPDILLTINTLFSYSGVPRDNIDTSVDMILEIFYSACMGCNLTIFSVVVNPFPREFFDICEKLSTKLNPGKQYNLWQSLNNLCLYKIWRYLYCINDLKMSLISNGTPGTYIQALQTSATYKPTKAEVYLILYKQLFNINQYNNRLFQNKSFNSICKVIYDLLSFKHKSIRDIKKLKHADLIVIFKKYKLTKKKYDTIRLALKESIDQQSPIVKLEKLLRDLLFRELEYKHSQKEFYDVCQSQYNTNNVFKDLSDVGLVNDKAKFRFLDIVDDVTRRKKSIYTTTKLYFYS